MKDACTTKFANTEIAEATVCTAPRESANNSKTAQTMWKWCGVRIASIGNLGILSVAIHWTICSGSADVRLYDLADGKTISAAKEKGKTMPNKDVIAYAVDADTGRITWVLYGERRTQC